MATRLLRAEPSLCMCMNHGVPMDEGDHSECSVELLACPEHRDEQMLAMGYEPGYSEEPDAEPSSMFKDEDGNPIVGFCLWCDMNFKTMEEHEAHTADAMANCPVFQELKDENCGPPVLYNMFQQAGLLDDVSPGGESNEGANPKEEK
jgi:hypothetical protein